MVAVTTLFRQHENIGQKAWDSRRPRRDIKGLREQNRLTGRTHIFIAGPGGFAVCLGQRQPVMGPVTLYEFDFEGARGGGYEAALSFPVAVGHAAPPKLLRKKFPNNDLVGLLKR
jgi:hypothetical protein